MKSEKLWNNYWNYNQETAQTPSDTRDEVIFEYETEWGCWGVQKNSHSDGSSAFVEHLLFLHKISSNFCFFKFNVQDIYSRPSRL